MEILLAHAGKQHSYHVATALHERGLLKRFYTSSYVRQAWLQRLLTANGSAFWTRRFAEGLPADKVQANWRFELPELLYRRLFGSDAKARELVYQRDVAFDRHLASRIPNLDFDVYWGFQGSCHASLQAAKHSGRQAICELATAHVTAAQKILADEKIRHPRWAHTIDNVTFPSAYEARLREEPHRADWVIAASRFTQQTLLDDQIPAERILYLPLGFDAHHFPAPEMQLPDKHRPLRLLYVGRITQRKGVKYLLEATRTIAQKEVELHLLGNLNNAEEVLKPYKGGFHYHPPVSQLELFRRYSNYDVLILPTIFEGFGLVIVEAMAAGLPVITTPHSIGPDVIEEDVNGYIIPIRDVEAIKKAIGRFLAKSPEELLAMRQAARAAALAYSWDAYRNRLETVLKLSLIS